MKDKTIHVISCDELLKAGKRSRLENLLRAEGWLWDIIKSDANFAGAKLTKAEREELTLRAWTLLYFVSREEM